MRDVLNRFSVETSKWNNLFNDNERTNTLLTKIWGVKDLEEEYKNVKSTAGMFACTIFQLVFHMDEKYCTHREIDYLIRARQHLFPKYPKIFGQHHNAILTKMVTDYYHNKEDITVNYSYLATLLYFALIYYFH